MINRLSKTHNIFVRLWVIIACITLRPATVLLAVSHVLLCITRIAPRVYPK